MREVVSKQAGKHTGRHTGKHLEGILLEPRPVGACIYMTCECDTLLSSCFYVGYPQKFKLIDCYFHLLNLCPQVFSAKTLASLSSQNTCRHRHNSGRLEQIYKLELLCIPKILLKCFLKNKRTGSHPDWNWDVQNNCLNHMY